MIYLNLMKKKLINNQISKILITVLFFMSIFIFNWDHAYASILHPLSMNVLQNPTPLPQMPTSVIQPTATVDAASIGDTSGVITMGMIMVIIIIAGILWGSREYKMEIKKKIRPKDQE